MNPFIWFGWLLGGGSAILLILNFHITYKHSKIKKKMQNNEAWMYMYNDLKNMRWFEFWGLLFGIGMIITGNLI